MESILTYTSYIYVKLVSSIIQAVPLFKPDDDLLKLLKVAPLKRLQYVAVEGTDSPK